MESPYRSTPQTTERKALTPEDEMQVTLASARLALRPWVLLGWALFAAALVLVSLRAPQMPIATRLAMLAWSGLAPILWLVQWCMHRWVVASLRARGFDVPKELTRWRRAR